MHASIHPFNFQPPILVKVVGVVDGGVVCIQAAWGARVPFLSFLILAGVYIVRMWMKAGVRPWSEYHSPA